MLQALTQETGVAHELQVDANGGWTVQRAREMRSDLMAADVVLLEQPIATNIDLQEDLLGFDALRDQCSLPLVANESCWDLEGLLRLAPSYGWGQSQTAQNWWINESLVDGQSR